jgi:predicted transcriptional regulator
MSSAKGSSMNLTALEQEVLDNIKNLLKRNVTFQLDSHFFDSCLQKAKAPEIEVNRAIYSLLERKIIVPGSALNAQQILENETRALIYDTIINKPGIHIRELCAQLNKSSGVVRAHLEVLEAFDFIRRKNYAPPKLSLLFAKDFPDTFDDYFLIMKNENDQQIIRLLISKEYTLTELSSKLNLHHSTIQYHLEKLETLNLIIRLSEENTIKYTFNKTRLETFMQFLDGIIK